MLMQSQFGMDYTAQEKTIFDGWNLETEFSNNPQQQIKKEQTATVTKTKSVSKISAAPTKQASPSKRPKSSTKTQYQSTKVDVQKKKEHPES